MWNVNSVLNLLVGGALSLLISFVWSSVNKTNEAVVRMETRQAAMEKKLDEGITRAEVELRLKAIDTQLLDMRVRQQQTELDLAKLRDTKLHW